MKYGLYDDDRKKIADTINIVASPTRTARQNPTPGMDQAGASGKYSPHYFGPVALVAAVSGSSLQRWSWKLALRNTASRNLVASSSGSNYQGPCTIPPGVPAYAGATGMLCHHIDSGGGVNLLFIPIGQWPLNIHLTTALPGGELYNATLYIPRTTDIDPSSNMSAGNLGTTGPTVIAMNIHGIGKSTHDAIYRTREHQRDYTGVGVHIQADGRIVVSFVATCCLVTCCNTICFTIYTGTVEGVAQYARVTMYDDGSGGGYSQVGGGGATLTHVGSDWVFYHPDYDTWTAPEDEDGCPPLDKESWEQTGTTGFLESVKCGDCSVEDCCESYCVTTEWEGSTARTQLPNVTPGVKWANGGDSIQKGATDWELVIGGSTYTAPLTGNPCPPLDKASWTLTDGDDELVGLECKTCDALYKQGYDCSTNDPADFWMTEADAAIIGTDRMKLKVGSDGKCFYFGAGPQPTHGTLYTPADVDTFPDCEECGATPPCCKKICVQTASEAFELVRGTVDTNTWSDGATPTPNQITKNMTTGGWVLSFASGSFYDSIAASDCPPTTMAEWEINSGDDILTAIRCGGCPCVGCPTEGEQVANCLDPLELTFIGWTGAGEGLNDSFALNRNTEYPSPPGPGVAANPLTWTGGVDLSTTDSDPSTNNGKVSFRLDCVGTAESHTPWVIDCPAGTTVWRLTMTRTEQVGADVTLKEYVWVACGDGTCCPPSGATWVFQAFTPNGTSLADPGDVSVAIG